MDVTPLLNPRSVAIVGASIREDSSATEVLASMMAAGYSGNVYPVNPRYPSVLGLDCYPSLTSLPEVVDAVFIGIPARQGPAILEEAGRLGVRAAYIPAAGYSESDEVGAQLVARVRDIATRHGIAVCGPNNMGLVNFHDRVAIWTGRPMNAAPGSVAIVTQSGSAAIVLSQDPRGLGLAYVITTGNELFLSAADFLDHLVSDDRVSTVLLFLETIRNPERFAAAADRAARMNKRIVVLKVGTTDSGRAAAMAHTGALAGDDRAYSAFFDRHGVVRVDDFDEMVEAATLFTAYPAPPPSPHVALMTLSGGQAALLADQGKAAGVSLPAFSDETQARIRAVLPSFSTDAQNPLDYYGLGWDVEVVRAIVGALVDDPGIGTVVMAFDAPASGGANTRWAREVGPVLVELASGAATRLAVLVNVGALGIDPELQRMLRAGGIPSLSGLRQGLAALSAWTRYRTPVHGPVAVAAEPSLVEAAYEAADADDAGLFRVLGSIGISAIDSVSVTAGDDAVAAAERVGYPVALKGTAPSIAHKAANDLVRLGVRDRPEVASAFDAIEAALTRLGVSMPPGAVLVQPMAPDGIELIVGIRIDPGVRAARRGRPRRPPRRAVRRRQRQARPGDSRGGATDDRGDPRGSRPPGLGGRADWDVEAAASGHRRDLPVRRRRPRGPGHVRGQPTPGTARGEWASSRLTSSASAPARTTR